MIFKFNVVSQTFVEPGTSCTHIYLLYIVYTPSMSWAERKKTTRVEYFFMRKKIRKKKERKEKKGREKID